MSCRYTKPHVAHLTISDRKAEKCPGVPADQPAPAVCTCHASVTGCRVHDPRVKRLAPAGDDELRAAGHLDVETARDMLLHPGGYGRSLLAVASEVVVTALDERGRERDAARAEVERLRRALAGHLFDGESLSTREALRSELVEQGLKDSAELERLHAMRDRAERVYANAPTKWDAVARRAAGHILGEPL